MSRSVLSQCHSQKYDLNWRKNVSNGNVLVQMWGKQDESSVCTQFQLKGSSVSLSAVPWNGSNTIKISCVLAAAYTERTRDRERARERDRKKEAESKGWWELFCYLSLHTAVKLHTSKPLTIANILAILRYLMLFKPNTAFAVAVLQMINIMLQKHGGWLDWPCVCTFLSSFAKMQLR